MNRRLYEAKSFGDSVLIQVKGKGYYVQVESIDEVSGIVTCKTDDGRRTFLISQISYVS